MKLLMIRHSYAAEPGSVVGGDFQRPLTDHGQRVFSHLAMWLVGRGLVPDRILHSPLVRAKQTAEILAKACHTELSSDNARAWIGSGLPIDELISELRSQPGELVAVIGHEPRMSSCTSQLVAGGKFHFLPGSMACIRFHHTIAEAQGVLEWMQCPTLFHA